MRRTPGLGRIGAGAALALHIAGPVAANPTSIAIEGGRIAVPAAKGGVAVFKGLPYAAPPVGPLRWRPPHAVKPWDGIRPVDRFGADCMQPVSDASPRERPRSEDCLYLNIWTSAKPKARQPVFVWIHGGGSQFGSGAQPLFDGSALARMGIVVVTINYRLGPFGFISTSALSAESGYRASGNYGFMDDIAALRWIRRNIAAFGGDPARVTIGGESSGSVSTGALMASPMAAGLFHQAIGESGSVFRVVQPSGMGANAVSAEEAKGDRLAGLLGASTLAAMRALPADMVLAGALKMGVYFNQPVVDGHVLPASPWRLFETHRANAVPLLVGWNAQEGSMQLRGHLPPLPDLLVDDYGPAAASLAPFYPAASPDDVHARIAAAGDNEIAYSTWKWALAQTRFGKQPVYLYEFDHAPPLKPGAYGPVDAKLAGAFHGAEIAYVFDTLATQTKWTVTPADQAIATQMSRFWGNFIRTGSPNGAGLPSWPRYDPAAGPQRMRIGTASAQEADPDYPRFLAIQAAHDRIDPPDPVAP